MVSGTESKVEAIDETQVEGSGSCDMSGRRKKKKQSKVWMYFQKIKNLDGGDCVECTECGKTVKTKKQETPLIY